MASRAPTLTDSEKGGMGKGRGAVRAYSEADKKIMSKSALPFVAGNAAQAAANPAAPMDAFRGDRS